MSDTLINSKILIPKWISIQSYFDKNGEQRVYISNEKNHDFLVINGITAELWNFLCTEPEYKEVVSFAKEKEIEDEIDEFLNSLFLQNLILIKTKNRILYNEINNKEFIKEEYNNNNLKKITDWIDKNKFLANLFLELTYKCNLNCVHCFNTKKNNKEIKFQEIKETIDKAIKLGVFRITLSGGECTITKDFLKIAKYIRKKRISLEIFTNGQKLYDSPTFFDEIVKLYPYRIGLSLYSMKEKIHDKITRKEGSWKKTIEIINKLIEKGINVEIKCFQLSINKNDYKEVMDYAEKIGANFKLDLSFINNKENNNEQYQVTEEQIKDIYTNQESFLFFKKEHYTVFDEKFKNSRICGAGHNTISIDPNLDIYPCCALKIKLGNIKENDIDSIWLSKDKKNELIKWRKKKNKHLTECFKEDYCHYCIYTPCVAQYDNELLKKSEILCRIARIKKEAVEKFNKKNDEFNKI